MSKVIFLATKNLDKLYDFQPVFNKIGIQLKLLEKIVKVEEDKDTLLENAKAKALANSFNYPDKIIMATDGGVKIPFLGDKWNHVLTRRMSGFDEEEKFTDFERAQTLLELMANAKNDEERCVLWEEAIILAYDQKIIFEFVDQGSKGILLREIPKNFSESGYWIGYLWFDRKIRKTYMEMNQAEKMKHSMVKRNLLRQLRNFDLFSLP